MSKKVELQEGNLMYYVMKGVHYVDGAEVLHITPNLVSAISKATNEAMRIINDNSTWVTDEDDNIHFVASDEDRWVEVRSIKLKL
jgi:hypothetical protein